MKGVLFSAVGAAPEAVDSLTKATPADDQVLVRSLWTAINPVDTFMSSMGLLVAEWPLILGVDAGGVVVSAGSVAESKYNLKPGTHVFGCTRLGMIQYSTAQEYYLMDAALAVAKPSHISVKQSATLGVACYTACLGLFGGLKLELPDPAKLPKEDSKDEWILILGGASSVGKIGVQIARACGYKVIASCSSKSKPLISSFGAETVDYKLSINDQVKAVLETSGGNISRVFDAVAENDPVMPKALFKALNENGNKADKYFTTTNDWTGITDFEGGKSDLISLGAIGRPSATTLNAQIASYVPVIRGLVEQGKILPADVEVIGDGKDVWADAIEAFKFQQSGKGGNKKVVVRIGNEN